MAKQKRKHLYTIFSFLLLVYASYAQNNLIKNPSFEQYSSCPTSGNQIFLANFWNALDNNISDTSECNGIYYNKCANIISGDYDGVPGAGVYLNYQFPKSGNGYIGIDLYCNPTGSIWVKRQYAKGGLIQTLVSGKTYCFKMWVNLSNESKYQCNNMMAYFDNGSIDTARCGLPVAITPQIINTPNVAITDTLSWVLVKGSFVANGTENTVTIGNFYTNANSQISVFNINGFFNPDAFYLIDDVSLIPTDLAPYAGRDTIIAIGDSVYIGRPSEIGLDDDCSWYVQGSSTVLNSVAGMWVKPSISTNYVVEQNICGTITYDTVKVTVSPLGMKQFSSINQLNVYPNPTGNHITLVCQAENSEIYISDVLGNILMNQKSISKSSELDISSLPKGVFFIQVLSENKVYAGKFVKE